MRAPTVTKIVLVETSHPGNIGAAARAMKNMGLSDLVLVNPVEFPHAQATARASGADDVLARATVVSRLEEALADCVWSAAASTRQRTITWPALEPREAARKLVCESRANDGAKTAVVFGPEKSGLSNEHLGLCQALLNIPSVAHFSSLNLAMAVQIVAYELRLAIRAEPAPAATVRETPLATHAEIEHYYQHLEKVLIEAEFLNPDNPRNLMQRLRRLFARAEPDQNEINILRGILTAVWREGPR